MTDNGKILLSDTGAVVKGNVNFEYIFEHKSFHTIDKKFVEDLYESFLLSKNWFSRKDIKITRKVFEELDHLYHLYSNKFRFLKIIEEHKNKHKILIALRKNRNDGYKRINSKEKISYQEKLFSEAVFQANRMVKSARKKILDENSKADSFATLVEKIENSLSLKSNSSVKYDNTYDFKEDFRTDEELVGYSLYLSQYKNKKVSLITKDFDIIRLVVASSILIPDFKMNKLYVYDIDVNNRVHINNSFNYEYEQKTLYELIGKKKIRKTQDMLEKDIYNILFTDNTIK